MSAPNSFHRTLVTSHSYSLVLALFCLLVLANYAQIKYHEQQPQTSPTQRLRIAKHNLLPTCIDTVYTKSSRKQNTNHAFINRHEYPICKFEKDGPIPVIFIINGRSGSDATWATLSTLAGGKSPIGEHTGENKVKAMEFLGTMTEQEGNWWVTEHLCQFAHKHCDKPLAAFKWKPFKDSWELPAAQGMLKKLRDFKEPRIKVIFMTRNPLDVQISKYKHRHSKMSLDAHCRTNDWKCIENMKKMGSGMHLPTNELLDTLEEAYDNFDYFKSSLKEFEIDHITTTYEDLYGRDDAEEWMRIFKFLGRGPTENLTMTDVVNGFDLAPTFVKHHNVSLANYEEVRDLLTGTEYEDLLH